MAIRIAVGAQPGRVMAMILREAGRLGSWSACCVGARSPWSAGRWLQSMLVGTAPSDPVVLGAAGGLMLCVAVLATFLSRLVPRRVPIRPLIAR